jgi:Ca2+-binding RTX toxin-like protein
MVVAVAKYSTSYGNYDFSSLLLANDYTTNSTLFSADYGNYEDRFTGTDLKYDSDGMLKSGTITGYQSVSDDKGTLLTITGLSISAGAITDAAESLLNTSDDRSLMAKFFAGSDQISGSHYVDHLEGFAGNDSITGGAGSDIMTGGAGADTFVFTKGSGTDVITDFAASNQSASHDLMDLSAYKGVDGFGDLSIHHAGGGVVVDFGADQVVLDHVKLSALDKSDFIF